jgi:hypothetical protein
VDFLKKTWPPLWGQVLILKNKKNDGFAKRLKIEKQIF